MAWREEYWKSIRASIPKKSSISILPPGGLSHRQGRLSARLTPTILTLIGLVLGVASGFFFYDHPANSSLLIGSALFILAGFFDSSDGQMARMGGKSTQFCLVLDGLCDNFVFLSVYVGNTLNLVPAYGLGIWPLAIFAGLCHSSQSSLLDFFNRDYHSIWLREGKRRLLESTLDEARAGRAEASGRDRLFWEHFVFLDLAAKHLQQSPGDPPQALARAVNGPRSEEFKRSTRA